MAGIYLHIPFCKQACNYCDFHFSTSMKMKVHFVQAIIQEIELRKDVFANEFISSVYFGGGTPSLLSEQDLDSIFEKLYKSFKIDADAEITLEVNPDDLTFEKIQQLKDSPVNRLSIGVQSFRDEDLKYMNRAHNAIEALNSIKMAQDEGFQNITIDLIYGTPGMSNEDWKYNLRKSFALNLPHISSYALTVEEKTPLYYQILKKNIDPVDEQQSADQFKILMDEMLINGYEQYEISNFCKGNFYGKHNSSYWKKDYYLGLGPSAHSYFGNSRLWNISNNIKYIKALFQSQLPLVKESLNPQEMYNEYVMTSLRTKWGCNLIEIEKDYSISFSHYFKAQIKSYEVNGYVFENKGIYTLSEKGKLIADRITSDLFFI
tara:strand:+ start:2848 stop:3975 length:1128 start_codon:yes stop_codon:yes gene_type:complete